MKEFFSFLTFQMRTTYGISAFQYNIKRRPMDALKSISMGLIILVLLGSFVVGYSFALLQIFDQLKTAGLEQLVLLSGVLMATAIVTVFGFFHVLGTIFFARDSGFLASLPLTQSTIFSGKFSLVMIDQLFMVIPLMATPGVIYGLKSDVGLFFYLKLLLVSLLLPTIPLAFASLISLVFMRVASAIKKRNTLISLGGFILLIATIAGEAVFSNFMSQNMGKSLIAGLVKNQTDLISSASRWFPPIGWATNALGQGGIQGLTNLILFALASLVAAAIAVFLASKLYQKGALAQNETPKSNNKQKRVGKQSSAKFAIFAKEWRILLRTPVYALNSLTFIVIGPLFLHKGLFGSLMAKDPDSQRVFELLTTKASSTKIMLLVAVILTVIGLINTAASTTLSREGKNFWLCKIIPVTPGEQIQAKFLACYSISFIMIILSGTTMGWSYGLDPLSTLLGIVLALVVAIPTTTSSVIIDAINPKLIWDNPTQAMKQNVNAIVAMPAAALTAAIPGYVGYKMMTQNLSTTPIFTTILLLGIILGAVLCYVMTNVTRKSYKRLGA